MEPMIHRGQMKEVAGKTLRELGLGQQPVVTIGPDSKVIDAINQIAKNKVRPRFTSSPRQSQISSRMIGLPLSEMLTPPMSIRTLNPLLCL